MSKNLFGDLLDGEVFFQASTIVEDIAKRVPDRPPFYSKSPMMSWGSSVGYIPGMMELLYGPKSSGKTMIVLDRIKESLKHDSDTIAILVDAELSFEFESTIRWMKANGVDTTRVMIIRAVCIKEIFEKYILGRIQEQIKTGKIKVCYMALDSVQAMSTQNIPQTEDQIKKFVKDDKYTKNDYGARANYLSKIFPFFRMFCRDYRIFVTFIGQARSGGEDNYGNQIWATNGGEALYHEVQYRTLVTPFGEPVFSEQEGGTGKPVQIGHRIKFKFEKNKAGEGLHREGFCDIQYMKGIINVENELAVLSSKLGLIEQKGAWFYYEGASFNGIKQFVDYLKENPLKFDMLFSKLMQQASSLPEHAIVFDEKTGEILEEGVKNA